MRTAAGGALLLENEAWATLSLSKLIIYDNGKLWKEIAVKGTRPPHQAEFFLHWIDEPEIWPPMVRLPLGTEMHHIFSQFDKPL